MMLREFECPSCGHKFEEIQDKDEKIICPKCDKEAKPIKISLSAHGKNSSWPVR